LLIDYIVVQAGGKGTRLARLTENKPKALVPIGNLPMLFHLFRRFPDKRFIIIADYKREILREYLECFADVKYCITDAVGYGTCGGVKQAIDMLPEDKPFMLIWSDLILSDSFKLPEKDGNYVGLSQGFPCRWSYKNGEFTEESSEEYGVAGLFIINNKSVLNEIPESGELVRYFKDAGIRFDELGLAGTKEYGLFSDIESLDSIKCRSFNKVIAEGNVLIKKAIDEQGERLAYHERKWYGYATDRGVKNIPRIYGEEPLTMERINGKNIYEYNDITIGGKRVILQKIVDALKTLHSLECVPADIFSVKEAYYGKTMSRLFTIRDLVPLTNEKTIVVNGRECRNIYFYKRDFERSIDELHCESFAFIHGDCTFSNLMLRGDTEPVFIDPRGYFGYTELYGDPNYDWAKLYYSIIGNYDRFNLKDFILNFMNGEIQLKIDSNGWEGLEDDFFFLSGTNPKIIRLIHAVIWLSLTTYAWSDYDSICGAFYNGLYYLEDVM